MEDIISEIIQMKPGYKYILKGLYERLLNNLIHDYHFNLNAREKQKAKDLTFLEIEDYIDKHYNEVNIKMLSDEFHYNEDYYNRLIKEYKGCTFNEYVTNIRLNKAASYLTSGYSVEDAMYEVGYYSRSNFVRIFKEHYGVSPSVYKKMKK